MGREGDFNLKQDFLCCCKPLPALKAPRDDSLPRVSLFVARLKSDRFGVREHQSYPCEQDVGVTGGNGIIMFNSPTTVVFAHVQLVSQGVV